MHMSDAGLQILRELEGCESNVYEDVAGLPTIGVGHLLTRSELTSGKLWLDATATWLDYREGLSLDDIDCLLRDDLGPAEVAVSTAVIVPLTQSQFDSLVSFVFNVGSSAFRQSTLLKRLNMGDYADVPTQLRRWIYAGGRRVPGLVNRREQEIGLWEKEI